MVFIGCDGLPLTGYYGTQGMIGMIMRL
jgi:hypothetical protein